MQSVTDLRLKRVLLKQEYLEYKEDYNGIREQEKELKEKPEEIIKYEYMLKRACFCYDRGDNYSCKGNHKAANKMFSKADVHFERLYEYLQEITGINTALWVYFDRKVTFDAENAPGLTPDCPPRIITSHSHYNQNKYSFTTRNDCKIAAIEKAILNLEYVTEQQISEQTSVPSKLKTILDEQFDEL